MIKPWIAALTFAAFTCHPALAGTETLRPNAAGTTTNLGALFGSCSGGSAYQCVSEAAADDATSYISKTTTGAGTYDTYGIQNSSVGTGTITGVAVFWRAKGTGTANPADGQPVLRTGGTDYMGTNVVFSANTNYATNSTSWATNPNTGVAWTWAQIDGMEAGCWGHKSGSANFYCTQVYVEVSYTLPKTWDGGGGDNNWNTAANWTDDAVPAAGDTVTFDATSVKNCVLNTSPTVNAIRFTSGYTGQFDFASYTLTVNTGWADFTAGSGASIVAGTGNITFSATSGTQTFTPQAGATFPALTKSGAGTVQLATSGLTAGALAVNGGTWDWGTSTLTHAIASLTTSGSSTMIFGTNTVQVNSGSADFTGLATLTANTGTLSFTAASGTQTFTVKSGATHPNIIHSGAGTLTLSTNALTCLSFSNSAGTLNLNGLDITTSGSGNFTVTNGTTSTFTNLAGRTITVGGNASLSGQSGNLLNLNPGGAWTLTATAGSTVSASYATIAQGTVNPSSIAGSTTNCTDGGSNVRWTFPIPIIWNGGGTDGTCGGGAGDGNKWSCTANWNLARAPTSTDTVVFNGTSTKNCKLDANTTIQSIGMASGYTGTFDFQSYALTVTLVGDFRTGGAITPGTGKIAFTGSSAQVLVPPGVQANSTLPTVEQNGTGGTTVQINRLKAVGLTLANLASNGAFNLGSGFQDTITTTLTLNTNGNLNFGSSTLNFDGNTADFSSLTTLTVGTGTLSFIGGSGNNVTLTPKSGLTLPAITKPNGNIVTVATTGLTMGAFSMSGGSWNWGSSTLTHSVASITATSNPTMTFGTNTVNVTSGNADFSACNVTANTGTLGFTASSGTQVFTPKASQTHPNIVHSGAGTLQLSTNLLNCLGFTNSAGPLNFNSQNITSSGNISVTNGTSTTMVNLGGRTLTASGNVSLNGTASSALNLNPTSIWTATVSGTLTANLATIGNATATGTGAASSSDNVGGNTNWTFSGMDYTAWPYSSTINFNTTSTGANVMGNVANFPLLVRLDSNNFFFYQAQPDGKDVRFSDPDGTALPYEIERWDATLKKAELWVKVPQIDGNSNRDYILMYWGNARATAGANASLVFPTSNNFAGIWHLNNAFGDATANANNGTNTSSTDAAGIIARGRDFAAGSSQYVEVPYAASLDLSAFTFSAWTKVAVTGASRGIISSRFGGEYTFDAQWDNATMHADIGNGTGWLTTNADYAAPLAPGVWNHVAWTFTANAYSVYLNGAPVASGTYSGTPQLMKSGETLRIGQTMNSGYFSGTIDEPRVENTVRSADWIKLAYETQRQNTTTVNYPNAMLSTWAYSNKIYVNTTFSGANTVADVANFPMLVRLSAANFNFSQAKSDGGDLRFADSTGVLFPYEIERFDATNKVAEIWVLIPTVKGNNNSQWFRMYWGKPYASSLASPGQVFSASDNWVGVWHLNTTGTGARPNAVSNGNPATPNAYTGSEFIANGGISAGADSLYGSATNNFLNIGTGYADFTGGLTYTVWANPVNGGVGGYYRFIDCGTGSAADNFLLAKGVLATDVISRIYNNTTAGTDVTAANTLALNVWQQYTMTVSGSTGYTRIFKDGVLVASGATGQTLRNISRTSCFIGKSNTGADTYYKGKLDEPQLSKTVRSDDWIKLSYESQKAGSTVVQIGPRTPDFAKAARFNFNTTASGANVTATDVTTIPILFRLTSSNFDFSVTRNDGADLQFIDKDGTFLYHEVVEWDKANKAGKVWARIPQVDKNSTTDYVTLYYGCATCNASPYAVPDSVWSAYRGVWHLNGGNENRGTDVTRYKNHLTYQSDVPNGAGITAPQAPYFDGTDGVNAPYATVADPVGGELDLGTTDFSFMTWMKSSQAPQTGYYPVIFGKVNTATSPRYSYAIVYTAAGADGGKTYAEIWSNSVQKATPFSSVINNGAWHMLVAKRTSGTLAYWVDGVLVGSVGSAGATVDNADGFYVAGCNGNRFQGSQNDVKVAATAFSDDYIKMSYQNQKATDALLSSPITTASFQKTKVFKLNTTASGANVPGDVFNFPLLLRLSAANGGLVDLVQTGAPDIRFLDADGVTWLDYSIERWNTTLDSAEVWVKVPRITGNDAGQTITMYYQQASGVTVPDGQCMSCVFGTSTGYSAVWHMNDSAATAVVDEAMGATNDGTLRTATTNENTSGHRAAGVIGHSLDFRGGTVGGQANNILNPLTLNRSSGTISHWLYATAVRQMIGYYESSDAGQDGFGAGASNVFELHTSLNTSGTWSMVYQDGANTGATLSGTTTANAAEWYHVVTTWSTQDSAKLYINGVREGARDLSGTTWAKNVTSQRLFGRVPAATDLRHWYGRVDELQVANQVRSADWNKLAYQNQRRDANLLFNPSPADFQKTRKYVFNTTRTGAGVMDSVANFPVLVRITDVNGGIVDLVQNNAPDIRFLDGDGKTWLNYQIERWDKTLDSAEVWVLVPKVDGNSDHDGITLYYQQASGVTVGDGQCPTCVFSSTANGFAAAYHLATNVNDARAAYNGTDNSTADAGGIIGRGRSFNGSTGYVSIARPVQDDFTIGFWMNTSTDGASGAQWYNGTGIVDGEVAGSTDDFGVGINAKVAQFGTGNGDNTIFTSSPDTVQNGTWKYVVATRNKTAGTKFLYLDGVLKANGTTNTNSLTAPANLNFGRLQTALNYYTGNLDEIQISSVVRDSNWIKLSYETQRRTGNAFWNTRPGPSNLVSLTATAGNGVIALSWNTPVSDSSNADSVGLWVKYAAYPDSANAAATTRVVTLAKADSIYTYPATYPGTYYFALAVRNTSGQWSPFTKASSDTANLSGILRADTVYVDSAIGSDGNSCASARNPATPKLTIGSATGCETQAVDTLVIRVMPGTYAANNTFDSNVKPIVIASFDNNSRAVLNGSGTGSVDGATRYWTVLIYNDITLRSLDIRCATNDNSGVYISGSDNGQAIEGCRIYNNGALKHDKGIEMGGTSNYHHIANNLIHQPTTYGIHAQNDNSFNIVQNVIYGNGAAGSKGVYMSVAANAADMTIANNIFHNWDYGIQTTSANVGVCSNNLFFQVTSGREVTGTSDANKILKDPQFANTLLASPHAFKLLPGSPAIDAGTTSYGSGAEACAARSATDAFGSLRTLGSAPDIGMYEGAGYVANPTGAFDTLTTVTTSTTATVKNSKWKIIFDQARGGGINFFADVTVDSTVNLLASNSLLFDAKIDAYTVSAQTGNTFAPVFLERNRTRAVVRQRLAVSSALDLYITYTVYASGHVYIQSEISNLAGSTLTVGTVDYTLKVGTATAAGYSGGGPSGFGYLATSSRDALLATTQRLDGGAAAAETWAATATSGAGGTVVFNTADLENIAQNMKRQHHFLLYIGDGTLDYAKSAAIGSDPLNPTALSISSGSLLHERSWQDELLGHWTLDEGGGAVARDKSVLNANNAALSGSGAKFISGKVAGGLYLTSTDVAVVTDAAPLEAYLWGSYMFWIRPDFTNMGSTAFIVSKGTTTSNGWYFRRSGNAIAFTMGSGSVTSPALTDGVWSHIAATLNGAYISLYVNGVLVARSTTLATAVANASNLRFGENAAGGAADRFQGDLDDIRIYAAEQPVSRIQSIYNRGFSAYAGHYHVRVDNNNRLVALLNAGAAQTRVQPSFLIDNWYGTKTPKFVYLNGARLLPNTDFVVDSIGAEIFGSQLVLQLNKTLTGADQTFFLDDDDSTGYMGEASRMKALTISATANDKIVIKNFADTVFGSAPSGQLYLELDLNGWTTPTASPATNGFGEFNVWKAAAINPNVAVSAGTNQAGLYDLGGRTLTMFQMDYNGTNYMNASGYGYAGPANITYTLTDSSSTRLSLTLSAMTYSGNGNVTMTKRWTVYPTGRIFGSYQITASNRTFNRASMYFQGRYNGGLPTPTWSTATATSTARYGLMGGDLDFHSFVGGILSIKSAGATVTAPASMDSAASPFTGNNANNDYYEAGIYLKGNLFESGDVPTTLNFAMDLSKDFTDSATADSLMKDIQTPALLTAITGTRTTNDALDYNADNFAEGDGAYTYAAAGGVAHFKFANTVTSFNPAFRIGSWTQGVLPEVVILDNQILTKGYHYNAFLNTTTNEVVMQLNKTLAPGTHLIFISHKTGLAVALNRFEAKDGDGVDTLEWATESEFENLGYHVWRRVAPAEAQVDLALAEGGVVAGAGIANALRTAARSEAAKRAAAKMAQANADTGLDTLPSMGLTPEELRALGYERITPRIIPGAKGGSSASTQNYTWIDRTAGIGTAYEYLLEAVDFNGAKVQYGPRLARPQNPLATELGSNYPNPFNPVTTLRFSLKERLRVSLLIYDAKGKLVRTLVRPDKPMNPGKYRLLWDAKSDGGFEAPSGQYFYRLKAGRYVKTRKMILVK